MSVNAVSGTSLQRDLASALRLARTGGTQALDASAYTAASQGASAAQGGSASQTSTVASAPAMSNDLMASLLQLQSDFSQLGLQNGVTTPADASSTADTTKIGAGSDESQGTDGAAPAHHRRRHAHLRASDAAEAAQAGQSSGTTDAAATSGTGSATATDTGDGLQSFLQQVTKAIAAYATGGPVGIAAAALTTSSKA
jgi:hypothetical protein